MSIYLDHNATTPLAPEAARAMEPFGRDRFANPSGLYPEAVAARRAVSEARERLAACLGCRAEEVLFNGGATEGLNHALLATALARDGGHLVAGGVEHAAVRRPLEWLARRGFQVTFVRPQRTGLVTAEAVAAACRPETFLVALQAANNELGTVQPVAEVGTVARRCGALFLVDAVQALGKLPLDMPTSGADLLAVSAHKVGGPKGVGALVVRTGVELPAWLHGGGQEAGRRAGTENVAGAVGFAAAAEVAVANRETWHRRWTALRPELLELTRILADCRLNGHETLTLPNTVSLAFRGIDAVELTVRLGERGVCVSPGAACCAGERSEILAAIGLDEPAIAGTVRFSMGPDTALTELQRARSAVVEVCRALRRG